MSVFLRQGSPHYVAEFRYKGHRFSRSTGETVEREARRVERQLRAEFRAEIDKQGAGAAAPWTLDQAFGEYERKVLPKLAKTWKAEVERYARIILTAVDKDMPVADLTDSDVEAFVDGYAKKGAGKYAVNRALAVWRRVHNLAKKRWKQDTHVIEWSEFLNREEKRVAHLEVEEALQLIKLSPDALAHPIEWSILTGCRRFETFGLIWEKINLAAGYAKVTAKGGREHTVWLTADTMDLLSRVPRNGRYVFDGKNWRKSWDAARKKIGKPDLRWHDLRHTHATWLRRAGAALEVVQRSLGHGQLATTERYAHVVDDEVQAALRNLPSLHTITPKIVPFSAVKSSA